MRPFHLWRRPSDSTGLYGVPRRRQECLRQQAYALASRCWHTRLDNPYDLPEYVSWRAWWNQQWPQRGSNEYACFAGTFHSAVTAYWAAQDQGLLP